MYAVVGCSACEALWIVEGRPETTRCRRCGKRRQFEKLRTFVETDEEDAARDARSRLLADRSGHEVEGFATLGERTDDAGMTDEEYLAGSGLDPDEVASGADRTEAGERSLSRRDILEEAIQTLDSSTEDAIVAYVADRGVPEGYVREALPKLARAGEITENGGEYRLL